MTTVGIIAEFNPFHNGHAYIVEQAKQLTGADYCVVVMSGDFVQRGAPAVCDKYTRTRMALLSGADAVFELPVAYATATAEIFAEAGVRLLASLGCVDYLVFGSECGDIDAIMQCAAILADESEEYKAELARHLKKGVSFPAARAAAYQNVTAAGMLATAADRTVTAADRSMTAAAAYQNASAAAPTDLLSLPNNILAVEYCKALLKLQKAGCSVTMQPLTVMRKGCGYHDILSCDAGGSAGSEAAACTETHLHSGFASATAIRELLEYARLQGKDFPGAVYGFMPSECAALLSGDFGQHLPVTCDDLSDMLHIRLATASEADLRRTMDMTEELANAVNSLRARALPAMTFSETAAALKAKNRTYTSVSRALLHLMLGIDSDFIGLLRAGFFPDDSRTVFPYARLLGFRSASSPLLRSISDSSRCIMITKPADAYTLLADSPAACRLFDCDVRAASVYMQAVHLIFRSQALPTDLQTSPLRL